MNTTATTEKVNTTLQTSTVKTKKIQKTALPTTTLPPKTVPPTTTLPSKTTKTVPPTTTLAPKTIPPTTTLPPRTTKTVPPTTTLAPKTVPPTTTLPPKTVKTEPPKTILPPKTTVLWKTTINPNTTKFCPAPITKGKRYTVKESPIPTMADLEKNITWVEKGGHYRPPGCEVNQTVAIIIPYRGRPQQLMLFILHMHSFLRPQQIEYTIFVIEQTNGKSFNRGKLMNIGFTIAKWQNKFNCFIFHDVDLLPEDDRISYTCNDQPKHMSISINIYDYKKLPFAIFGGVTAFNQTQFEIINGYCNMYWGWGGEDDDLMLRVRHHKFDILKLPEDVARYTMIAHKKEVPNPNRHNVLGRAYELFNISGLNTLNFTIVESKMHSTYSQYLVEL